MPHNIDYNEISKFDSLAAEWWDRHGKFKPLHDINPLRLNFITQHADIAGKTVIDIGCGGGILTESLTQSQATVTGIDMATATIEIAKDHASKANLTIDYQQISAEEMADQHPGEFDVVTCMELLEHVPDPASIVNACSQLLKPNGMVFFSTINRNVKAYIQAILAAEYLLNLLPKNTHQYDKFIRPAELDAWARNVALTTRAIRGITYNPFIREYKLSNDIDVNYLVCYQKAE